MIMSIVAGSETEASAAALLLSDSNGGVMVYFDPNPLSKIMKTWT